MFIIFMTQCLLQSWVSALIRSLIENNCAVAGYTYKWWGCLSNALLTLLRMPLIPIAWLEWTVVYILNSFNLKNTQPRRLHKAYGYREFISGIKLARVLQITNGVCGIKQRKSFTPVLSVWPHKSTLWRVRLGHHGPRPHLCDIDQLFYVSNIYNIIYISPKYMEKSLSKSLVSFPFTAGFIIRLKLRYIATSAGCPLLCRYIFNKLSAPISGWGSSKFLWKMDLVWCLGKS